MISVIASYIAQKYYSETNRTYFFSTSRAYSPDAAKGQLKEKWG